MKFLTITFLLIFIPFYFGSANSTEATQFNKGLSFYQQGQEGMAKAYWRSVLFQNPYNRQVRLALNKVQDERYFWLWIPEDIALLLMALGFFVLCFSMWRFQSPKKAENFYRQKNIFICFIKAKFLSLIFSMICFSLCGFYFYFRLSDYQTLKESSAFLSAPDPKAPVLFERMGGVLLKKIGSATIEDKEWSHVLVPNRQTGWLRSHKLIPVCPSS